MTLDGNPIRDMTLARVEIEIGNEGSVDIDKAEFSSNIEIKFSGGVELLTDPRVTEKPVLSQPVVAYNKDEGSISIEPMLIKAGERYIISFLSFGNANKYEVDCRIANVSVENGDDLDLRKRSGTIRRVFISGFLTPVFASVLIVIIGNLFNKLV